MCGGLEEMGISCIIAATLGAPWKCLCPKFVNIIRIGFTAEIKGIDALIKDL